MEAGIEYRKALQKQPGNGQAHYKLALVYEAVGDRANAARHFIRAADALPQDDSVQLKAAQYLLFARRFDEARRKGEQLLKKNARNLGAQLVVANALAGLKDLNAAVERVEEAIRQDPGRVDSYANLAAFELAAGNVTRAEDVFRSALASNPKSVEARLGLANLLWANGKQADAEALLREALTVEPKHLLANRTLAAFCLANGRVAEAEAPLKTVAEAQPHQVFPRLALADYYLATNRGDEGLRLLEQVAKEPGGMSPAVIRMAGWDYSHGRQPAAHHRLDELLKKSPKDAEALLAKAGLLLTDKRLDEALASARAAAEAAPRLARAHYLLARTYLAKRDDDQAIKSLQETLRLSPRFGAASLELAQVHLNAGRGAEAVQFADEAVRNAPGNPQAHYVLIRALMLRGQRQRAEAEMKPMLAQFGNLARVQSLAGLMALSGNDKAGARKAFTRALKLDPNDNDALSGMLVVELAEGRQAEARKRLEARLAATPNDPAILPVAARTLGQLGLEAESERAWRKLLEIDAGNLEAYGALGRLYYGQKRLDAARAEFERLARSQPRSVAAHTMVAFLLEMEGRTAEAQKRYEAALAVDAHAPVAANNLAWLYGEQGGNLDVALQLAQTAKAGMPDAPEVNDTLGWLYYRKGLYPLAAGPLLQAATKDPKNPVYQYHLGMAYSKTGDTPKARAALQEALRLDASFQYAPDARRALAVLR